MALFKILKGQSANLPNTYHEGYCYFTTDTKKFYIDISSENDPSSRVELNANIADYAARAYYDEDGINIKNNYLKTGTNSSLDANEILITDNQKNVTTRKLVEEYSIVSALPATPDQNIIYLIEDGEDSGGSSGGSSGGGGGTVIIANTLSSGTLIATINGTNIYSPTVPTSTSDVTNEAGYLTLSTLPKYDGTVV